MVKVTSPNGENKITVRDMSGNITVTTTGNLAEQYARTSQAWATSEGIIAGQDYSSKHYANVSKEYAEIAKGHKDETINTVSGFQDIVDNSKEEIEVITQNNISNLRATADTTISEIEEVMNSSLETFNTTINESVLSGEEEIKEAIKDVKVIATMELGDIGFTQLAIDEARGKRRVLNGQLIVQEHFPEFTKKIKDSIALNPDLACSESNWQTAVTMSTIGVCYKFVIDDEAGTIRLPKYPNYINKEINYSFAKPTATTTLKMNALQIKGNGKTMGFMDGNGVYTGTRWQHTSGDYGLSLSIGCYDASLPGKVSDYATGGENLRLVGLTTDASKSGITGSVTGTATTTVSDISATKSEEIIKGTWFIQVATGIEEEVNITNEIELNNPFSLLDYKWSEYELNNLSWLCSKGQWNAKSVYPAVYDLLLRIHNGAETKAGVSVKLSNETFTDYDFVLDTANENFRLPIKVNNSPFEITGASTTLKMNALSIKGSGKSLGLSDGTNLGGIFAQSDYIKAGKSFYNVDIGATANTGNDMANLKVLGVTTDASKSGLTGSVSGTATTTVNTRQNANVKLYFYVGETVQNANLINAGRITETIINKVNKTGDTITGTLTTTTGNTAFNLKSSNIDLTTTPTATKTGLGLIIGDKFGTRIGGIESQHLPNGTKQTAMNTMYTNQDGTRSYTNIRVGYDVNGNWFTYAPTPATGNNSTNIATTQWVHNMDSTISGWCMPSTKCTDLTLGASGSSYTMPANGWLQCACTGTAGSTFFELAHNSISCCASFNGGWGRASMPVKKGMVIVVYYGGTNFTKQVFRFTYAEGDR